MKNLKIIAIWVSIPVLTALTACGGGGGGNTVAISTGPVVSTLSFPLRQAVNTVIANGESFTMAAIGTNATQATDGLCSGSLNSTVTGATTSTTFRGQPALSSSYAQTLNFTNCTPITVAESGIGYYDSNYVSLGDVNASSGRMGVWQTAPNIPTTIRVGDVVIVGTTNYFTTTAGTVSDGRSDMSLVVEADTATTAILNQIIKQYNASGQLTATVQGRSRIDATGRISRASVDIQYAPPSTNRLVFRR